MKFSKYICDMGLRYVCVSISQLPSCDKCVSTPRPECAPCVTLMSQRRRLLFCGFLSNDSVNNHFDDFDERTLRCNRRWLGTRIVSLQVSVCAVTQMVGPFEETKASLGKKTMCEQKREQKGDSRGSGETYKGLNYIRHVETSTEQVRL